MIGIDQMDDTRVHLSEEVQAFFNITDMKILQDPARFCWLITLTRHGIGATSLIDALPESIEHCQAIMDALLHTIAFELAKTL